MIGRKLGNFEVIEELGRGGMGVVYRARQLSLNRVVALKVLPRHNHNEKAVARFEREAHAMAQLQHPNVVDVIEVGEQDGVPYFAMQYVDGEGLDEIIRREGPLPPERAAALAAQVADGLQHAHERGVVHRDIKPSNVLIAEGGRAVVTDFGVAKAVDRMQNEQSLTQGAIGTPEYMSPEVIRGNPIDGRTDVYSLGVVLYHMVTGRAPFTATTPYQVADRHLRESPPLPSSMGADCPDWLETIILKALAKEPSERFASAAEMAAALRSGTPVAPPTTEFSAPPASAEGVAAGPRAGGDSTRQRNLILALAAAGALLLVTAVVLGSRSSGGGGGDSDPVRVPSLSGLTWTEAQGAVERLGLSALRVDDYSDTVGEDEVISQQPSGGTLAEPDTVVELTVSMGAPSTPPPSPPRPVRAVASSVLDGKEKYGARNAIDGRDDTAWVEGADGSGIGEWIRVELREEAVITGVRVLPGYDKVSSDSYGDRWWTNNRVARARITFDDGTAVPCAYDTGARRLQDTMIDPPARSRSVRIEITEIDRGSRADWDDACIGEIQVVGYEATP